MKAVKLGLALAVAGALVSPLSFADNDNDRGRGARAFDVCVSAGTDARVQLGATKLSGAPNVKIPGPGDRVTVVGMMLPVGTVASDGSGDVTCALYQSKKIGAFFVNGTFVSSFDSTDKLPQAADNDLGYVQWHFRVDGVGAFETSGPIKQFVQGGTYPQVITGGTGRFKNARGEMTTVMLGAGGFQIRVMLPDND